MSIGCAQLEFVGGRCHIETERAEETLGIGKRRNVERKVIDRVNTRACGCYGRVAHDRVSMFDKRRLCDRLRG
jgi:hypothetical protein